MFEVSHTCTSIAIYMYNIRARQAERHTGICTSTMSYKSFWPALGISCTTACLQTGESPYRKTIGFLKNYYVIKAYQCA